ncbi:hypothetical protein [Subtercola boreus]|uniref:hypothetical protein n=1 Tax=Subtercola boreus TaxID=120213 RepID=UPI0011C02399|nr:hypothetical protein [Subtercola boreus]
MGGAGVQAGGASGPEQFAGAALAPEAPTDTNPLTAIMAAMAKQLKRVRDLILLVSSKGVPPADHFSRAEVNPAAKYCTF